MSGVKKQIRESIAAFLIQNHRYLTLSQMAEELNMDTGNVYHKLNRLNLKPITIPEQQRELVKELGHKKTIDELAKMLAVVPLRLEKVYEELNMIPVRAEKVKPQKKRTLGEIFNTIHYDINKKF